MKPKDCLVIFRSWEKYCKWLIASGSLRTMKNSGIDMAMRAHPLVLIQVMASATSFCHHPVDLTMSTLKLNQRKSSCLYIPPSLSQQQKIGTREGKSRSHQNFIIWFLRSWNWFLEESGSLEMMVWEYLKRSLLGDSGGCSEIRTLTLGKEGQALQCSHRSHLCYIHCSKEATINCACSEPLQKARLKGNWADRKCQTLPDYCWLHSVTLVVRMLAENKLKKKKKFEKLLLWNSCPNKEEV